MLIIQQSPEEFSTNKKLLAFYSKRQLLAMYELLLDERFSRQTMKLLLHNNLIHITTEQIESFVHGFTETTYIINTI
jgi:hypothetical protein